MTAHKNTVNLNYQKKHNKKYRAPKVNAKQTPEERREKYKRCREHGLPPIAAQQFRDFDMSTLKAMGVY